MCPIFLGSYSVDNFGCRCEKNMIPPKAIFRNSIYLGSPFDQWSHRCTYFWMPTLKLKPWLDSLFEISGFLALPHTLLINNSTFISVMVHCRSTQWRLEIQQWFCWCWYDQGPLIRTLRQKPGAHVRSSPYDQLCLSTQSG